MSLTLTVASVDSLRAGLWLHITAGSVTFKSHAGLLEKKWTFYSACPSCDHAFLGSPRGEGAPTCEVCEWRPLLRSPSDAQYYRSVFAVLDREWPELAICARPWWEGVTPAVFPPLTAVLAASVAVEFLQDLGEWLAVYSQAEQAYVEKHVRAHGGTYALMEQVEQRYWGKRRGEFEALCRELAEKHSRKKPGRERSRPPIEGATVKKLVTLNLESKGVTILDAGDWHWEWDATAGGFRHERGEVLPVEELLRRHGPVLVAVEGITVEDLAAPTPTAEGGEGPDE